FRSKQEILAEVLLAGVDAFGSAVDAALPAPGPPPAAPPRVPPQVRLRALTAELARLSVERRDTAALWRWQRQPLAPADQAAGVRGAAGVRAVGMGGVGVARPGGGPADAELLRGAAMSVFGSGAAPHTTPPQERFAPMLAAMADGVLASPVAPANPVVPATPVEPASPVVPANPVEPAGPAVPDDTVLPALRGAGAGAAGPPPADPAGAPSRREAVLAGATRLFRQRGYHAVSMDDIGAAVGIAGPSVYRHFASKADLLCAACTRM